MADATSKDEAREFLMSRRAAVSPVQAGITPRGGDGRRVAGLRREEVAMLAGVSVDYYTKLERGNLDGARRASSTASRVPSSSTTSRGCTCTPWPARRPRRAVDLHGRTMCRPR